MTTIGRRLKRKLMISIAVAAVLAGATAAIVMASQPSAHAHHHRAGALTAAAGYLAASAAALPSRIEAEVDRTRGHAGAGGAVKVTTTYLGLSRKQLRSELRSGKTLAQVANATAGKSEAGLIEALVAAKQAALAASVKAGTITQAQADARLPKLVSRVTARVQRTKRARG